MMYFLAVFMIALLQGLCVSGTDTEVLRDSCFENKQDNCDTDFVDAYPELSRSEVGKLADTYFLLYTRRNPKEPELLHKCAGKLPPNTNFNPNNRIILLAPSYLTDFCELDTYREWRDEILKKEDANVIAIDFNWDTLDYQHAHENLRLVAKQTAVVLDNIKKQTAYQKFNIMIVGISLGGQLAGYIGKVYDVERIVGLDPAGPLFNDAPEDERLNSKDAHLVEFWHCNAGQLGASYEGGHVNFYINSGKLQESCHETSIESIEKGDIFTAAGTLVDPACSHIQCTAYFKDSINPGKCQYLGVMCNSYEDFKDGKCGSCGPDGKKCLIMGFDTEKYITDIPKDPQIFYVKTKFESPFCDNDGIDLDGYAGTYKSSLQKTCKKKEKLVNESFFEKLMRMAKDLFV